MFVVSLRSDRFQRQARRLPSFLRLVFPNDRKASSWLYANFLNA